MTRSKSTFRKRRNAAILTLFVFVLPLILLVLGFSIDMAYMQLVQTEMRLASDNAARIAADNLSKYENEARAVAAGIEVADDFLVAGTPLRLKSEDFDFGRMIFNIDGSIGFDPVGFPPNAVKINAVRNEANADGMVPLFFSRLIGRESYAPEVSSTAAFLNVDICLVLDRSTSMKFAVTSTESGMSLSDRRFCRAPNSISRWTALDNAVRVFTHTLNTNSAEEQVSIVTYGSDISTISPTLCGRMPAATLDMQLSTNIEAANGTMNTLSNSVWNGNTEIAAGMQLAINELTSPRSRRFADKVMIVMTDGFPTAGDALAAATAAAEARITVYAITFGPDGAQSYMRQVAALGHGEHAHAVSEAELKEIFQRFAGKATVLIE